MINYKTAFLNEFEAELEEENLKSNSHVSHFLKFDYLRFKYF